MSRRQRPQHGAAAALLLIVFTAPASAGFFITYDQRQNLNVLNSPEVTITASHFFAENNDSGGSLRGGFGFETSNSGVGWFSGPIPAGQKEVFTISLGRYRNVQTLHLNGPRNILSATIETSHNGSSWTPLAHSTTVSGSDTTYVLNSAVDTRWLRVTGETYAEPSPTVGLYTMRLYGAPGTLTADPGTDLVSSSAWTAGGVTISQIGGNITPASALTDIANDRPAAISRQLIFDLGTGDSVTATFASIVESIGRVGFVIGKTGSPFDTSMHFQLLGSTDGGTFPTLLVDQTGGLAVGPNFFDLPTLMNLKAVRLSIVASSGTDNRIDDFFVYQVPEPAATVLLAVGAALGRRRRR